MGDRDRGGERAGAGAVRIDRWLWAARFFRTRSLAAEAVAGGRVTVNGDAAKPARLVRVGDLVRVRVGPVEHVVRTCALAERRGSAAVAATLYEETEESRAARERLAEQHRMAPPVFVHDEKGRPTKRDRRELERFRERGRG